MESQGSFSDERSVAAIMSVSATFPDAEKWDAGGLLFFLSTEAKSCHRVKIGVVLVAVSAQARLDKCLDSQQSLLLCHIPGLPGSPEEPELYGRQLSLSSFTGWANRYRD